MLQTEEVEEPEIEKEKVVGRTEPEDLPSKLIVVAAFLDALRLQAHLLHLNYGPAANFLSVHGFLKDRYERHQEQFDLIAEHVMALGARMPGTGRELRSVLPEFCECDSINPDPVEQLQGYHDNLRLLVCMAKAAADGCGCAIDVENSLAELVGDANKASWMLSSMLCG
ncbi:MAG: hypothetical protein WBM08_04915 [Prochlorococcaceae cyanobacterium]